MSTKRKNFILQTKKKNKKSCQQEKHFFFINKNIFFFFHKTNKPTTKNGKNSVQTNTNCIKRYEQGAAEPSKGKRSKKLYEQNQRFYLQHFSFSFFSYKTFVQKGLIAKTKLITDEKHPKFWCKKVISGYNFSPDKKITNEQNKQQQK